MDEYKHIQEMLYGTKADATEPALSPEEEQDLRDSIDDPGELTDFGLPATEPAQAAPSEEEPLELGEPDVINPECNPLALRAALASERERGDSLQILVHQYLEDLASERTKREGEPERLPCRSSRPMTEQEECCNYECPNFDPDKEQNCSGRWTSGDDTEYAVERCLEWKVPCQAVQHLRALLKQARPAPDAMALREALERIANRKARAIIPWTHEAAADEYARMLDADRADALATLAVLPRSEPLGNTRNPYPPSKK